MSSNTQKILNVIENSTYQPTDTASAVLKCGYLSQLTDNISSNTNSKVNKEQPPVLSSAPHIKPYLHQDAEVTVFGRVKPSQYSIQLPKSVSLSAETAITSRSSLYRRRRPTGVATSASTTDRSQISSTSSASDVRALNFSRHVIAPMVSSSHAFVSTTTIASNASLSLPTTQRVPSHSLSQTPFVVPETSTTILGSSHSVSSADPLPSGGPSAIAPSTEHLPPTFRATPRGASSRGTLTPSSSSTLLTASRVPSLASVPSSLYVRSRSRPVPAPPRPSSVPSAGLSTVQTGPSTPSSIIASADTLAPVPPAVMTTPVVVSAHIFKDEISNSPSADIRLVSMPSNSTAAPHGHDPTLQQRNTLNSNVTTHHDDANADEDKSRPSSVLGEVYSDPATFSALVVSSQELDWDTSAAPIAPGFQLSTDDIAPISSVPVTTTQPRTDTSSSARVLAVENMGVIEVVSAPALEPSASQTAGDDIGLPKVTATTRATVTANAEAHFDIGKPVLSSHTRFPDTLDGYTCYAPVETFSGTQAFPAGDSVSPKTSSHTEDDCIHEPVVEGNSTGSAVRTLSTPTHTQATTLPPRVFGDIEYDAVCFHNSSSFTFNPSCWRGPSRWCTRLDDINKRVFGHSSFRPLQRDIILACLERRDVLAVLPTGQGKSLCYHMLTQVEDGLCLVISPLVSLMDDQERELRAYGIPCAAIHSNNRERHAEIFEECMHGKLKALFLAPERVVGRGDTVDPLVASLSSSRSSISTDTLESRVSVHVSHIVIDEVHCITTWGKTFRDSMMRLGVLREHFPSVPILALTATVTLTALAELVESLRLRDCVFFRAPFDRPNLTYNIRLRDKNHIKLILDIYKSTSKYQQPCGIVYCFSHRDCDNMAQLLSVNGAPAVPYYGSLPPHIKKANADAWMRGDKHIICATTAFGMGINKSNVRFIIHDTLPASLEDYHQECGRAGRDGLPSMCLLLYRYSDVTSREALHLLGVTTKARLSGSDSSACPPVDGSAMFDAEVDTAVSVLDNASSSDPNTLAHAAALLEVRSRIHAMYRYCVTRKQCRRAQALAYFGESYVQTRCKACDMCLTPPNLVAADVSGLLLMLLHAIRTVAAVDPMVARHSLLQRACLKSKLDDRDANLHAHYRLTSAIKGLFQRTRGMWQQLCRKLRVDSEIYVFDEIVFSCIEKGWVQKRVVRVNPGEDAAHSAGTLNETRKDNPFFACYSLTPAGDAVLASQVELASSASVVHRVSKTALYPESFRNMLTAAKDILVLFLPRAAGPAPQHIRDSLAFTQSTFTQPSIGRSRVMASQAIADSDGSQRDALPGRTCVPSLYHAQAAIDLFRKHGTDRLAIDQRTQNPIFSQGSQKDFVFPRRKLGAAVQQQAQASEARTPQAGLVSGSARVRGGLASVCRRGYIAVEGVIDGEALSPPARLTSHTSASNVAPTVMQNVTAIDKHENDSVAAMFPASPPRPYTRKRVFVGAPHQPTPADISTSKCPPNAAHIEGVEDVYAPPLSGVSLQSRLMTRDVPRVSSRVLVESTAVKPVTRRPARRDVFDDDDEDEDASQALDTSILEATDNAEVAPSVPMPPPPVLLSPPAPTGVFSLFSQDSDAPGLLSPAKPCVSDANAIPRVVGDEVQPSVSTCSSMPISSPSHAYTFTSTSVPPSAPQDAYDSRTNALDQTVTAMNVSDDAFHLPAAPVPSFASSLPVAAPVVSDPHFVDLCTQGTPAGTPAPIRSMPRTEALAAHEHLPLANDTTFPTPTSERHMNASSPQFTSAITSHAGGVSIRTSSRDILSQPPPLLPPTPLLPPPLKRTSMPIASPQLPAVPVLNPATPPPTTTPAPWADTSPAVPTIIGDNEGRWVDVRVHAPRPPRLPHPPMAQKKKKHTFTLPVEDHVTQSAAVISVSTAPAVALVPPHNVHATPISDALTAHAPPQDAPQRVISDNMFSSSLHDSPPGLAASLPPSTGVSPIIRSNLSHSVSTPPARGNNVMVNLHTPSKNGSQHVLAAPISNFPSPRDDILMSSLPYSLPPSLEPLDAISPITEHVHAHDKCRRVGTSPLTPSSRSQQSLSPLPPVVVEHRRVSTPPSLNPAPAAAAPTLPASFSLPTWGDDMQDAVCRAIDFDTLTQSQNVSLLHESHSPVGDGGIPPKKMKLNDGRAAPQPAAVNSPSLCTTSAHVSSVVQVAPIVEAEVVSLDDSAVDISALDDSVIVLDDDDVPPPKPSARPTKRLGPRLVQHTQSPESLSPLLAHSSAATSVSARRPSRSHTHTVLSCPRLDPQPSDPFLRVPIAMGGSATATGGHRGQAHGRKTTRSHASASAAPAPSRRAAAGASGRSACDLSASMWPSTEHSPAMPPVSVDSAARSSSSSSRSRRRSSNHHPPEYDPGHVRDDIAANMFGESAKEISLRRVELEEALSSHLP